MYYFLVFQSCWFVFVCDLSIAFVDALYYLSGEFWIDAL